MKELVRSYKLYDVVRERDNNALKGLKIGVHTVNSNWSSNTKKMLAHNRINNKLQYKRKIEKVYQQVSNLVLDKMNNLQHSHLGDQFDFKTGKHLPQREIF